MSHTLTNLIPDVYVALDVVSREQVGLIPSVSSSFSADRVALNQTVRSPVAPAATAADVTPGANPPDTGDQTVGNQTLTISKSRAVPVRWDGDDQMRVESSGVGYSSYLGSQFEQAMRTLCNEVESDLAALYKYASRAYGTVGTTPFGTAGDFSDGSNVLKILKDNGAPGDRHLVLNTTHGASLLGKQSRVDVQGADNFLRQGILLPMHGMSVRESGQLGSDHTPGTASSSTTTNAGFAVGATTIALASAGTGTFVAGDVITFAGDPNKYLVVTGDADVSNGGSIVIAAPGLRQAIPASATAITRAAAYDYSMAFSRNAIVLATRVPARPKEGDKATDVVIVTDPRSGLAFEIAMYPEYRRVHYEVALAWGTSVNKTEHLALLLG